MTESKHTPGPWTHEKSSVVFNTFPHTIGFHDGSGGCLDQNWSEADARLMAAAPDLLQLAYQYRDDLRHPPAPDSVQRRLQAIEAAIAKATA